MENIKEIKKSYKGMTGRWTKWGGRIYDIVSRQDETPRDWRCQSCGDLQPAIFPAYKYEYPKGEWIRCCSICYVEQCMRLMRRLALEALDEI
jgi:hypothetical protein